jgi:hypothetical protein
LSLPFISYSFRERLKAQLNLTAPNIQKSLTKMVEAGEKINVLEKKNWKFQPILKFEDLAR